MFAIPTSISRGRWHDTWVYNVMPDQTDFSAQAVYIIFINQYLGAIKGKVMSDNGKKIDRDTWAIGGGVLLGLGVGFFFLHQSALYFIGSLTAGIGIGLLVTAILSKIK